MTQKNAHHGWIVSWRRLSSDFLGHCDEIGCHRIALFSVRFENGSAYLCTSHLEKHGVFVGRERSA